MLLDGISHSTWGVLVFVAVPALAVWYLYRLAMPKPIPGIPYNKAASRNLMGDVPAIMNHMAKTEGGNFITYALETMRSLDAPLIQLFVRPFSKPMVILGDFPEAHDMMMHRSEFDRSPILGGLIKGVAPNNHLILKTGNEWKNQRKLIQDLMTPSFLHNIAGPAIHQNVTTMIDLWRAKSHIANGRPWKAVRDVNQMALDAVTAFAFGADFKHNATRPALLAVQEMSEEALSSIKRKGPDEVVEFPKAQDDDVLQAIRGLTGLIGEIRDSLWPDLTWAYLLRKPSIRRLTRIKEECITRELKSGVQRIGETSEPVIKSAVDQMIVRERSLAEKDGRLPNYFSRVMFDEVFGFVFGGYETTSTTLCWGLKFLSDNPSTQNKLREALQGAFGAGVDGRNPSIQEITNTSIPFLDATIEEILRCGGTIPFVDRVATVDTEILGHHIPKGTCVFCIIRGPGLVSPGFDVEMSRRSPASQSTIKDGRRREWDPADMAQFNPDRWIVRSKDGSAKEAGFDSTAGPQLAFGLGTRSCYGKRLAYLKMRIALTLIVRNFELLPCPEAISTYHANVITTSEPRHTYVRLREISLGK